MKKSTSIKNKILKGGAWALSGKIITTLLSFLISVLLVRTVPPEDLGLYFISVSVIAWGTALSAFGQEKVITRFIAENIALKKGSYNVVLVKSIIIIVAISIIVLFVLLFNFKLEIFEGIFKSPKLYQNYLLIFVLIVITTFQRVTTEALRGFGDIKLATLFGGTMRGGVINTILLSTTFVFLFFLKIKINFTVLLEILILVGTINLILSVFSLTKKKLFARIENDKHVVSISELLFMIRRNIETGFPLLLSILMLVILTKSDMWILGSFVNPSQVAIYGSAARLITIVTSSLIIVNSVLPPVISELNVLNEKIKMEKVIRTIATISGIPALLITLLFLLFPRCILGLLFGDFYTEGAFVLIFLSLGQLANVLAGSCGLTLMMTGNQKIMMVSTLFSGIITLAFAFFLVENYSIDGVAFAFGAGMILQNVLMVFAVKLKLGIWTHITFNIPYSEIKRMLYSHLSKKNI